MADTYRGSCFCGGVEIEARGAPEAMGYCHCGSCRSYSGAPVTAFTLWKAGDVAVTRGADRLANFNKIDFSGLKLSNGGGVAVQQAVNDKWKKATGTSIIEGYGLSETSPVTTFIMHPDSSACDRISSAMTSW